MYSTHQPTHQTAQASLFNTVPGGYTDADLTNVHHAVKGQSQSVKELLAMMSSILPEDKKTHGPLGMDSTTRFPLGNVTNGFKSLQATPNKPLSSAMQPTRPASTSGRESTNSTPMKSDVYSTNASMVKSLVVPGYRMSAGPGRIQPSALMELCLAFVNSLQLPSVYFDSTYNEYFGEEVYGSKSPDWTVAGGRKYTIPRNWVRFGLFVDPVRAKVDSIWENWCVSFHGTNEKELPSTLYHRQLLFPGDALLDGSILEPNSNRPRHIYTSPSIYYSSLFAPPVEFIAPDGRVLHAQMVLQCMQRPSTFQVQHGNPMVTSNPCPYIPFSEIEYTTDAISSVVPYGLLVRICEHAS